MSSSPRVQLSTQDPEEAHQRLAEIYCPHTQTVLSGREGFRACQRTSGFPGLDLYELGYGDGEVHVEPVPFEDFVLVSRPVGGPFAVRTKEGTEAAPGGRSVVLDAFTAYELRWGLGCKLLNIRLGREHVERLAAEIQGLDAPVRLRFGLGAPSAARARSWDAVSQSLWQRIVPSGIAATSPLVRTQVLRLTVAALLDTFPHTVNPVEPVRRDRAAPSAVRRAVSYIDQYAADDIDLHDIADAARLSVRALQAAFRKHKDTTPLGYLREVRMSRAHAELRDADPEGAVTVSDVACRWGFGNLGRFAEEHRKAFGATPSQVLRSW